jgi:hypothetical protein
MHLDWKIQLLQLKFNCFLSRKELGWFHFLFFMLEVNNFSKDAMHAHLFLATFSHGISSFSHAIDLFLNTLKRRNYRLCN